MKWLVDEREVPAGSIGVPPMNYGQHWRWDAYPKRRYRLLISTDEFERLVAEPFNHFLREIADDLKVVPEEPHESALGRLRRSGFPPLSALLRRHHDLLRELVLWLDDAVLQWLDNSSSDAAVCFCISSLDRVVVEAKEIQLEGVAFELEQPNA